MRLICNADPIAAGIQQPDGAWRLDVFDAHCRTCPACGAFAQALRREVGAAVSRSRGAAQLGRRRWRGVSAAERSATAAELNRRRWSATSAEERKAVGQRLAEARKRKREQGM